MKVFNDFEIREQLKRDDWKHEDDIDIHCESHGITYGEGIRRSTLGDMTVEYRQYFKYEDYEPDTSEADNTDRVQAESPAWKFEGFRVIDDGREYLDTEELSFYFEQVEAFVDIDYSDLIGNIAEITDVDFDADSNMETVIIDVSNQPDIRFTGERIAFESDEISCGIQENLTLYKTINGKFICHKAEISSWNDGSKEYFAKVCQSENEVIEFFESKNCSQRQSLAEDLLEEAEIKRTVEVSRGRLVDEIVSMERHFGSTDWAIQIYNDGRISSRHSGDLHYKGEDTGYKLLSMYGLDDIHDINERYKEDEGFNARSVAEWVVNETEFVFGGKKLEELQEAYSNINFEMVE